MTANLMRVSKEFEDAIKALQKKVFDETGMKITYTEASRILAREFNPDKMNVKSKKKGRGVYFDFGI